MFVFEGYIVHEWERAGHGVQGRWCRRKMPQACSECNHRTADVGEKRRARAKMLGLARAIEHGRTEHALRGAKVSRRRCDAKTCGADGVFAKRMLSDNGVRDASGRIISGRRKSYLSGLQRHETKHE